MHIAFLKGKTEVHACFPKGDEAAACKQVLGICRGSWRTCQPYFEQATGQTPKMNTLYHCIIYERNNTDQGLDPNRGRKTKLTTY